jgi:predicted nucleic acid-binding protein
VSSLVLLDTSIFIDYFRKKNKKKSILFKLAVNENILLFTSSIVYYEYFCGVDYTDIFEGIEVLPFLKSDAEVASEIYKKFKKKNSLIGEKDILIAASAINNGMSLATLNMKHFKKIEDLEIFDLKDLDG